MRQELIDALSSNTNLCTKEELNKFWLDNNTLSEDEFTKAFYEKYKVVDQLKTNASIREMREDIKSIKGICTVFLVFAIISVVGTVVTALTMMNIF